MSGPAAIPPGAVHGAELERPGPFSDDFAGKLSPARLPPTRPAIPPEAVQAVAVVLHDEACGEDTGTCRRWNSKVPGGYDPQRHIGYYEDRAREALKAAEAVWPHDPPLHHRNRGPAVSEMSDAALRRITSAVGATPVPAPRPGCCEEDGCRRTSPIGIYRDDLTGQVYAATERRLVKDRGDGTGTSAATERHDITPQMERFLHSNTAWVREVLAGAE